MADGTTREVTDEVAAADALASAGPPAIKRQRVRLTFECLESAYEPHVRVSKLIKYARRVEKLRVVKIEDLAPEDAA